MSSSITLSAASRQNLLSLQDTASLTSTTQNRLATGKKVSSALDNPVNFFTSQALDSRAGDLNGLLDGISNGIQTIQAANQGITSIQKLVDQAKSITSQALASKSYTTVGAGGTIADAAADTTLKIKVDGLDKSISIKKYTAAAPTATPPTLASGDDKDAIIDKLNDAAGSKVFSLDSGKLAVSGNAKIEVTDSGTLTALGFTANTAGTNAKELTVEDKNRTSLAKQFNSLLSQIDQLAKDASYNGVNLISSGDKANKLHIAFNENNSSSLDVSGSDLTSGGLKLDAIDASDLTKAFQSDTDISTTASQLTTASSTLRSQASTFGSNLSVVQNRQDFSKQLINVLGVGSANLTNADLNEEAANSQALSTRQSLGISALSLANQAQQGVLQLLR